MQVNEDMHLMSWSVLISAPRSPVDGGRAGRGGWLPSSPVSERQCCVADPQQNPDNPENLMPQYFFYKEIISMESYRPSGFSGFYC